MITRVTDQMKFDLLNNSMATIQSKYNELMEKLSVQKQVNKPSDDPGGMGKILDYRSAKAQISHYQKNVDSSKAWLSATESNLSSVNDIITQVKEMVIVQSSATTSPTTRQIAADALQPLIDQVRSLANGMFGNRYLFSGSRTETEPFSAEFEAARIDTPVAATENGYAGTVSGAGTYTGATNKTYVVKIVAGGALGAATYQVSADGGKTWGVGVPPTVPLGGTIADIGDGISLTFTAGTFVANDIFYVHAYAPGYYNGDGEDLASEVGKDLSINYNITGETVFTDHVDDQVGIFETLDALKTALSTNDAAGIVDTLTPLNEVQNQINRYVGRCGTRTNSLDTSSSTLVEMDVRITGLTSNIEDADVAKLVTEFQMKQVALQASYKMAADLTTNTILNFLR